MSQGTHAEISGWVFLLLVDTSAPQSLECDARVTEPALAASIFPAKFPLTSASLQRNTMQGSRWAGVSGTRGNLVLLRGPHESPPICFTMSVPRHTTQM